MNTTTTVTLVLLVGVALAALYIMSRDDGAAALLGSAPAPVESNRPEATYYIESVGGAVSGVLGGIGSIMTAAYGGGGGSVGSGGARK